MQYFIQGFHQQKKQGNRNLPIMGIILLLFREFSNTFKVSILYVGSTVLNLRTVVKGLKGEERK